MRVAHLPVYAENAYQPLLMESLRLHGVDTIDGGGGGNFLRTALFQWKADILHFHWLHPYMLRERRLDSIVRAMRFLCEVSILRLAGARVVWTIHNLTNHNRHFPKLERFFTTQFTRLVDGVVVHSQSSLAAANATFKLGNGVIKAMIPQGSYAGHYPNQLSRSDCRRNLNLNEDDFVFVFLGRIEPYKGVRELIHSFKQLDGKAQLLIAGRVSNAESLKLLQETIGGASNIHLHEGFVPDGQVQLYLNAADVYVYPVRDILNSGSIPLAMSFGLPCIAPRIGGVPEALGEDGGILYNPDDSGAMVGALRRALSRKTELCQIGAANLARARDWTWKRVARQTRSLYDQCLRH